MSAIERAELVKRGLPARAVQEMSAAMGLPRDQLMRAVGLARSTVERKLAARGRLSEAESEKLVGLSRLIGQVDAMVRESGEAPVGFDAARWFAAWMGEPVAALGGLRPQQLLDTADGREALATRWRWPPESLRPCSPIGVCSPCGIFSINPHALAALAAATIRLSSISVRP